LYNKHTESSKRDEVIINFIKKSVIIIFLLNVCLGCSQDKNEPERVVPFQCISDQSRCEVITKFGTVLVKFNVEKVLTELPFQIQLEFKKDSFLDDNPHPQNFNSVVGHMEGKTMFMGKIPLFFNNRLEGNEDNPFIAETMLGSCSEDRMTWRIWITLEMIDVNNNKDQTTFFIDVDSTRY
jgi:hypothetical protein